jgi:hypothetical protein
MQNGVSPHFLHFFGGIFWPKDESLEDSANLPIPTLSRRKSSKTFNLLLHSSSKSRLI